MGIVFKRIRGTFSVSPIASGTVGRLLIPSRLELIRPFQRLLTVLSRSEIGQAIAHDGHVHNGISRGSR